MKMFYFTDPMCSWCYGFSPVIKKLKENYAEIDLEITKIEREKTVIQFHQSVLNAFGKVSDELTKTEKLKEQYEIAQKRFITLQLASKNAGLLFKNGVANYLEALIAQENLLQSELELAVIKTQRLNAVVQLYRSLGGGWN